MALSSKAEIHSRLKAAYDLSYYQSVWNKTVAAYGPDPEAAGMSPDWGGKQFPDFPPLQRTYKLVGRNMRIANALQLLKTKVMGKLPEPDFPNLSRIDSTILKEYWRVRATRGEWIQEFAPAFIDGVAFGNGVCEIFPKVNPLTGRQGVDLRYVPINRCLWDPVNASMGNATYIAFCHYIAYDTAVKLYGKAECDAVAIDTFAYDGGIIDNTSQQVRIIRYYDVGIAGKQPTQAVLLGDLDGEVVFHEALAGDGIPFCFFEFGLIPGCKRPPGLIDTLIAGQAALDRLDAAEDAMAAQTEIVLTNPEYINEEAYDKLIDGETSGFLMLGKDVKEGSVPYVKIEAPQINQTHLDTRNQKEKQFRADAGITEFDQGSLSDEKRTLGENQLVAQRSSSQMTWAANQCVYMYRRAITAVLNLAKVVDDDPFLVDIQGVSIWINDEEDERLDIANFIPDDIDVIVTEESLTIADKASEIKIKMDRLNALVPFVGQFIDPQWFVGEMKKLAGYEASEGAMQAPMPQAQPQMADPNLNPQAMAPA
jgi:hypothetical protein